MKKRLVILCIMTMLFSTGMEGCPDLMDYVEFTLTTTVNVQFYSTSTDRPLLLNSSGTIIRVVTQKAGGQKCEETILVPQSQTVTMLCTHQVYNQQPVETFARKVSLPQEVLEQGYTNTLLDTNTGKGTFTWEDIFASCGNKFGSSCAQSTSIELQIWLDPPTYDP